jgi:hypothetical protein
MGDAPWTMKGGGGERLDRTWERLERRKGSRPYISLKRQNGGIAFVDEEKEARLNCRLTMRDGLSKYSAETFRFVTTVKTLQRL